MWVLQAVSDVTLYSKKTMSAHLAQQLLAAHDMGYVGTLFSDFHHMTFEITAGITVRATQTQQNFDTSLFVKNNSDARALEQIFFFFN